MNIVVLAPHPDDEILGCGGVIARHVFEGDNVYIIVITRGIAEVFSPKEIADTRIELNRVHNFLGIKKTFFLDYPAPALDSVPQYKIADDIKRILIDIRPTLLYLPHYGDIHIDHRITHHAGLVAARPVVNPWIKKILAYETVSETEWSFPIQYNQFAPNVYINIEQFIDIKIKAASMIKTQMKGFPHPRSLETLRVLATFRGSTVGLKAAEAFWLVREIID